MQAQFLVLCAWVQGTLLTEKVKANETMRHPLQIECDGGWETQPAFTCSKLTIETKEQGVKYVKS